MDEDSLSQSSGVKSLKVLQDSDGLFTRGMGMSFSPKHTSKKWSWPYSAVINDCAIEKIFIEVSSDHSFETCDA